MTSFANENTEVQRVRLTQGHASSAGRSQGAKPEVQGLTQLLSSLSKDAGGGPSTGWGPSPGRVPAARIWYHLPGPRDTVLSNIMIWEMSIVGSTS